MAVAVIQEFPIEGDDRTTTNYDRVQEELGVRDNPPAGGLVHTAGFDEQAGVFRIFDVWESEEAWNAFFNDRLLPIVQPLMEQGAQRRRRASTASTTSCNSRQDAIERPRDACEVECLHQEHGVPLLAVPHEAVQLLLERPRAVRGLLLVRPERA